MATTNNKPNSSATERPLSDDTKDSGPPQKRRRIEGTKNAEDEDVLVPWSLRCRDVPDPKQHRVLWWESPEQPIPLHVEETMISSLMVYGKKERGMLRKQQPRRVRELRKLCKQQRISLSAACSLRRHHIKRLNLSKRMRELGLGKENDINESSRLFEVSVAQSLDRHQIPYYDEKEQRQFIEKNMPPSKSQQLPYPVTPDFILRAPILIKIFCKDHRRREKGGEPTRRVIIERSIHWIEAKMFYGASTIEEDNKSAVGCLLRTARKYVRFHGPGAMIFMQGFGDRLAEQLLEIGVVSLDCWGPNVELSAVHEHQKTWCADGNGNIMP